MIDFSDSGGRAEQGHQVGQAPTTKDVVTPSDAIADAQWIG
jgi:hypothetical protein